MSDFRRVTDTFTTSPQITLDDVARAGSEGYRLIVNNRPDGEADDQPASAQMEAAAKAAGLAYIHIPVRGAPTPEQARAMRDAMAAADGPTLAFCRSGTRSINAWAMGEAMAGARGADELKRLGAAAGYDLSGLLG